MKARNQRKPDKGDSPARSVSIAIELLDKVKVQAAPFTTQTLDGAKY